MPYEEEVLKELRKISKILILGNGDRIESHIGKYATTTERKKIWVLIDGKRQASDIAQIIGITKRGADMFLKVLEDANLIERPFNKPSIKIMDYVPAEWVELVQTETKPSEKEQEQIEPSVQETNQTSTEEETHG